MFYPFNSVASILSEFSIEGCRVLIFNSGSVHLGAQQQWDRRLSWLALSVLKSSNLRFPPDTNPAVCTPNGLGVSDTPLSHLPTVTRPKSGRTP
jgi:hypothetical protein